MAHSHVVIVYALKAIVLTLFYIKAYMDEEFKNAIRLRGPLA